MEMVRGIRIACRHHFRFARLSTAAAAARVVPVDNVAAGTVERTLECFTKGGAAIDRMRTVDPLAFVFQRGDITGRHMKVMRGL